VCARVSVSRGVCACACLSVRWGRERKKNFYLLKRVSFGVWCVGTGSREARLVGEQGRKTLERIRGFRKRNPVHIHTYKSVKKESEGRTKRRLNKAARVCVCARVCARTCEKEEQKDKTIWERERKQLGRLTGSRKMKRKDFAQSGDKSAHY